MTDKIRYLARHGDEYDVFFLGSSRVHSQVMPSIFDRCAMENGVVVKSFNAGVAGMFSPENSYMLEEILRRPHRRLRWVFLELAGLNTEVSREETARFGYWHDNARLMFIAKRVFAEAVERQSRLGPGLTAGISARWEIWSSAGRTLVMHARSWLMRAVVIGRGAEVLTGWLNAAGQKYVPAKSLGPNHDGWMTMDRNRMPMAGPMLENYKRACAERLARPAVKERGNPVSQELLERFLATVVHAGAVPVLIVSPAPFEGNFFPTEARERELTIFDFSDVRLNPDLFAPEYRVNLDHLNNDGSKLYSEDLARRFVELVKRRGQSPGSQ